MLYFMFILNHSSCTEVQLVPKVLEQLHTVMLQDAGFRSLPSPKKISKSKNLLSSPYIEIPLKHQMLIQLDFIKFTLGCKLRKLNIVYLVKWSYKGSIIQILRAILKDYIVWKGLLLYIIWEGSFLLPISCQYSQVTYAQSQ